MDSNKFWIEQPYVLISNYLSFIPTPSMSSTQQYNAITLFCIYFIILLIIFKKNICWFYLPIVVILLIVAMNYINSENFTNSNDRCTTNSQNVVESGYYDSDGELRFTRTTCLPTKKADVTYSCKKPTPDNPFMNPPISDFNTANPPVPCNSDDEDINNEITKAFNSDLYMDVNDVFSKQNSQRQFYTVPNTSIPNNQQDFANWLYRAHVTCKEDQEQCLRYEDLRFKR